MVTKDSTKRLKIWASILEDGTRRQAEVSASMPFIHPHLALMPDAHLGKGATVGSVIPTLGAIMPAAVGVDIGCGMMALRLDVGRGDVDGLDRRALRVAIEGEVPVSAGGYNRSEWGPGTAERIAALEGLAVQRGLDPTSYAANWRLQLGSLGSGNHFIEVSADESDRLWLFLHSGSRGVGNKIAMHHIAVAQEQCARRWITLPDKDLAYLVEGEPEFDAYVAELGWAQEFARLNREEMMSRVLACFTDWTGRDVVVEREVQCHHNYTERERHFGKEVWLSRKGAISAREGQWGLIPGSMGTRSYVVTGRGDPVALQSAPHGAGRTHSRSAARRRFTGDDLRAAMGDIEYRDTDAFVDEIPAAYKDIDQVMADAADLVRVEHVLTQLVNVKGD
ncbi:RtcB family protein [Nocardioides sp. CFH 31398]|uniref:RtcB family protein n=1 Tax=Nocardioides sp. CFH 31398 TaxID=2919579 RepID=UPI001F06CA1C|nr:RtcB family protein [Nocardioides sp. CFH 31398]MCH1866192.1 RtcB family protein [Nocardioides sp. CFH 31398]